MSNILIIEDDTAIAELEKDYLELSEFHVEIEHEGSEGAARAIDEDFDLILLDLMLPASPAITDVQSDAEDVEEVRGI